MGSLIFLKTLSGSIHSRPPLSRSVYPSNHVSSLWDHATALGTQDVKGKSLSVGGAGSSFPSAPVFRELMLVWPLPVLLFYPASLGVSGLGLPFWLCHIAWVRSFNCWPSVCWYMDLLCLSVFALKTALDPLAGSD